ncbi:MAG: hypothetical protein VB100_10560 [Angelakisella sp.]|nr:hypothetical protein [Angelakisella sp.]
MKKEPTEKQFSSTSGNAKHKSRQVKKKSGGTSGKTHKTRDTTEV